VQMLQISIIIFVTSTSDLVEALLFLIRYETSIFCVTDNAAKSIMGTASPPLQGDSTYGPFV